MQFFGRLGMKLGEYQLKAKEAYEDKKLRIKLATVDAEALERAMLRDAERELETDLQSHRTYR